MIAGRPRRSTRPHPNPLLQAGEEAGRAAASLPLPLAVEEAGHAAALPPLSLAAEEAGHAAALPPLLLAGEGWGEGATRGAAAARAPRSVASIRAFRPRPAQRRAPGFTLIEVLVVIVILGIVASTAALFVRPAFDAYTGTRNRAALVETADAALRRMQREIRSAVPNSIRAPDSACFELVPTTGGGRFRKGPDTVNDSGAGCAPSATCSAPVDPTLAPTVFDVLTPLSTLPAVGDAVVVDNQNPGDVYAGANRAAISAIATPAATYGKHRITLGASPFPLGYDGGRFVLVPASQQAVFYVCGGADGTLDAAGNGKGTLYRLKAYGYNASAPTACPSTVGADVLASKVRSCRFVYDPNQGATEQSGFVSLQLELTSSNETASFVVGAHVANTP